MRKIPIGAAVEVNVIDSTWSPATVIAYAISSIRVQFIDGSTAWIARAAKGELWRMA